VPTVEDGVDAVFLKGPQFTPAEGVDHMVLEGWM
jgi:hypothetical protein